MHTNLIYENVFHSKSRKVELKKVEKVKKLWDEFEQNISLSKMCENNSIKTQRTRRRFLQTVVYSAEKSDERVIFEEVYTCKRLLKKSFYISERKYLDLI